jgi:hypothetical protein
MTYPFPAGQGRRAAGVLAVALAFALTGCGGDDEDGQSSTQAPSATIGTETAPPTDTGTTTAEPETQTETQQQTQTEPEKTTETEPAEEEPDRAPDSAAQFQQSATLACQQAEPGRDDLPGRRQVARYAKAQKQVAIARRKAIKTIERPAAVSKDVDALLRGYDYYVRVLEGFERLPAQAGGEKAVTDAAVTTIQRVERTLQGQAGRLKIAACGPLLD